ncbi:hypothetical protein J1N35_042516 [Gossypium stocksii]|uniref:Uncharacterized protein n=1 Tax=Gossypium stocksii TaxID=47602 RepID=A0A9D3U5P1_9ROSI|nr:hypothetical protein J1N35_042516 [Gossypium stocksii]
MPYSLSEQLRCSKFVLRSQQFVTKALFWNHILTVYKKGRDKQVLAEALPVDYHTKHQANTKIWEISNKLLLPGNFPYPNPIAL